MSRRSNVFGPFHIVANMLRTPAHVSARQLRQNATGCIMRHSSSTAPAQATIISGSSASAQPRVHDSPPVSSKTSTAQSGPIMKPQPFIPKPQSRAWQIKSLERTPASKASTTIHLTAGAGEACSLVLPNLFLRDASTHPAHVHPSSRQKLFRTTDVPLDGDVVGFGVHEMAGEDHLVMEWTTAVRGVDAKMAKLSVTPLSVLVDRLGPRRSHTVPSAQSWTNEKLRMRLGKVQYTKYAKDDRALLGALGSLLRDGIAFVEGVHVEEKVGHHTELRRLVERISSVRGTWYGDLFDVKAEQGSKNIAYTNLDLGLHMDLTHFESPPRYQFLHSLQNAGVTGGSSYFVDSYAVAEQIRASHPDAFNVLAREPMLFSYQSDTHHTRFTRPVIELEPGSQDLIHAVNYSPPFQGPLPVLDIASPQDSERLSRLHEALKLFADGCDDARNRYEVQLQPGDCVIFDNRRVLHARTAFEWTDGDDDGIEKGRWLKGAYCDGDEVRSKWRTLQQKSDEGKL